MDYLTDFDWHTATRRTINGHPYFFAPGHLLAGKSGWVNVARHIASVERGSWLRQDERVKCKVRTTFLESEPKHSKRLGGNFHHTRQLRRAILYKLNGTIYAELPMYLVERPLEELMRQAAVVRQGNKLTPSGKPPFDERIQSKVHQLINRDFQAGTRTKSTIRLAAGMTTNKLPYPYRYGPCITCDAKIGNLIADAFSMKVTGQAKYTGIAGFFNEYGFPTSTGGKEWNKNSARAFCQNPIHCGYAVTYDMRNANGEVDKRGDLTLTQLNNFDPPISLDTWLKANDVMGTRKITVHAMIEK